MRLAITLALIFCMIGFFSKAQQRLDPRGMNYVVAAKPNTIIFHDTVFSGKKQFEELFYRTHDQQLIQLLDKHQSNKIAGQAFGFIGTFAMIFGISKLSSSSTDKGTGWALVGGGFAATLTSGYLLLMGQRNLVTAVTLFNQRSNKASLGIGVSEKNVGLVYKF